MTGEISLLLAATVGFTHAFEADHLVAVGSLVTRRDQPSHAMKDGVYWGLGHSSTILLVGIVVLMGKTIIPESVFSVLEAVVGVMLIALGLWRLYQLFSKRDSTTTEAASEQHPAGMAYGVGLVHGLAGSGALVLLVMSEVNSNWLGLLYLLIFGLGATVGMSVAAGTLSLPLMRSISGGSKLRFYMVLCSALLCIGYGLYFTISHLQ